MADRQIPPQLTSVDLIADYAGVGDPEASVGTKEWAKALRSKIHTLLHDRTFTIQSLMSYLRILCEHQVYKLLKNEQGQSFTSLREFCLYPTPFGLGLNRVILEHLTQEANDLEILTDEARKQPLAEHGGVSNKSRDAGGRFQAQITRVNIVNSGVTGGNSKDYLLRRIARDHPEILDQIGVGKPYKSVRAAAISMGIIKQKQHITVSDPERMAPKLAEALDRESLKHLVSLLEWHLSQLDLE